MLTPICGWQKPGEVDVAYGWLVSGLALRRNRALDLVANLFAVQSEFLSLHMAAMTNDEIKQYDTGLFAHDPMWCIDKWRPAVLADPSHA